MITTDVQNCGSSVLISSVFQQALDDIAVDARDLMVDLHGMAAPWTPVACSTFWTCTGARNALVFASWPSVGSPSPSSSWPRSPASPGPAPPPESATP